MANQNNGGNGNDTVKTVAIIGGCALAGAALAVGGYYLINHLRGNDGDSAEFNLNTTGVGEVEFNLD